jgi:hypothetical protein
MAASIEVEQLPRHRDIGEAIKTQALAHQADGVPGSPKSHQMPV